MVEKRTSIKSMQATSRGGFLYSFNITAVFLIIFFLGVVPFISGFEQLPKNVDVSITAPLESPSQAFVPTQFSVDISNASSTLLNAMEFEIHFDPRTLLVTNVTPMPTLCEERFIISKTINNASGTILFQCGTITPFDGLFGTVATIDAIPLTYGTTSMSFGTTTHVLAHDGLGSDVTGLKTGYSFNSL